MGTGSSSGEPSTSSAPMLLFGGADRCARLVGYGTGRRRTGGDACLGERRVDGESFERLCGRYGLSLDIPSSKASV